MEGSGALVKTGEVETAAAGAAAEAVECGVREGEGITGVTGMDRHTASAGGSAASVVDAMGMRGLADVTGMADVADVVDAAGLAGAAGRADIVGAGMVGVAEMADAGGLTCADGTQVRAPAHLGEEFAAPVANVSRHAAGAAGPAGSVGSAVAAEGVDGGIAQEREPLAKLSIPMDEECLALARVTAAHVALLVGLPVDRAADLRLAVDEACSLFLAQRPMPDDTCTWWAAGDLELDFARHGTRLHVTVRGPARYEFDRDDVGWYLLEAMVGEVRADFRPGRATVTLVEPIPDRMDWGGLD